MRLLVELMMSVTDRQTDRQRAVQYLLVELKASTMSA